MKKLFSMIVLSLVFITTAQAEWSQKEFTEALIIIDNHAQACVAGSDVDCKSVQFAFDLMPHGVQAMYIEWFRSKAKGPDPEARRIALEHSERVRYAMEH